MSPSLTVDIRIGDAPSAGRRFFRVLHDWELFKRKAGDIRLGQLYDPGKTWDWRARGSFPEVQKLINWHKVPFDEPWQRLSFEMNPGMDPKKWRVLYDDHRAFTDRTGFWTDDTFYIEYRPARDYINGIDLNAPLPEFDAVRVCGGTTICGQVDGPDLIVETLRSDQPVTWEWLQQRPWLYFHAVVCYVKRDGTQGVQAFPQNDGRRVLVPLIALPHREMRFPLVALQEMTGIADPYTIYLP